MTVIDFDAKRTPKQRVDVALARARHQIEELVPMTGQQRRMLAAILERLADEIAPLDESEPPEAA